MSFPVRTLKKTLTTSSILLWLKEKVIKYENVKHIWTNQGSQFTSAIWKEGWQQINIKRQ
jgi:hypothetical protein